MRYSYILFFLLLGNCLRGQSIQIHTPSNISGCIGKNLSIPFTTTGVFPSDNQFRLQIGYSYSANFQDIGEISAAGPINLTIPSGLSPGSYYLRVTATKTNIISNSITIYLNTQPTAEINIIPSFTTNLNPYDPLSCYVQVNGGGPWQMTFTDSTTFTIDGPRSTEYYTPTLYPAISQTYAIASITNACGTGTTRGTFKVNVNSKNFRIIGAYTYPICTGSKFYLNYSLLGSLPENAEFVAEFIDRKRQNSSITVPVKGTANPLIIDIPQNFTASTYGLKLSVKNANLETMMTGNLEVRPSPEVRLSGSKEILSGKTANLNLEATGGSFISLRFNDGTSWIQDMNLYNSNNPIIVQPKQTTTYTIQSAFSNCGNISTSGSTVVKVLPLPTVDSVSKTQVCTNETFQIYISSLQPLDSKASYQLGICPVNSNTEPIFKLPATWIGSGVLEVKVPSDFNPFELGLSRALLNIITNNVSGAVNYNTDISFSALPKVSLLSSAISTIDRTERFSFYLSGNSGNDYLELELSDGTVMYTTSGYYQPVNVFPTAAANTYSVKSVKNRCGVGTGSGSFTVLVKNPDFPNQIYVQPLPFAICKTDSIRISFNASGKFNPGNEFRIEISDQNRSFTNPTIIKATTSTLAVNLPKGSGNYILRVVSTNPVLKSNEIYYQIPSPAAARIEISPIANGFTQNGNLLTIPRGATVNWSIYFNGHPPLTYKLNNSSTGPSNNYYGTRANRIYEDTEISFKSVYDGCNQPLTDVNKITVKVYDYQIETLSPITNELCINSAVQIPYKVYGTLPDNSTLFVQISSDNNNYFDVPTVHQNGSLVITVPDTVDKSKRYLVRVSAKTPQGISHGIPYPYNSPTYNNIRFNSNPVGMLAAKDGSSEINIEAGESAVLKLNYSGMNSAVMVIMNNNQYYTYINNQEITVTPTKTTTYEIRSIQNSCGFGIPNGKVKVVIKPDVKQLSLIGTFCTGSSPSIYYQSVGDFTTNNVFKFYIRSNNSLNLGDKIEVGQSKLSEGLVTLKIPDNLSAGNYRIEIESTNPIITKIVGNYFLNTKPTAVLSGNLTAYPNQTIALRIKLTGGGPYSFKMNDIIYNNQPSSTTFQLNAPTISTTFRITELSNNCGNGTASGEASVIILPNAANRIISGQFSSRQFCIGSNVSLDFTTNAVFETANKFTVQLSDSTGLNFKDIPTMGTNSPLQVTIPANTPVGSNYRFRIISSQPAIESASSQYPINILPSLTGTLSTLTPSIMKGDTARLKLDFTGESPWDYVISSINGNIQGYTYSTPFFIDLKQDTTISYRLNQVSNATCGKGVAQGTVTVTVSILTALEPVYWPLQLIVYPNPTESSLLLQPLNSLPFQANVRLLSISGQELVSTQQINATEYRLNLNNLTQGTYILEVEHEGKKATYRIIKK